MQVKGLSDVFVASGIEMVDDATFTAMLYGYWVRGKIRVPSAPVVEFFFYGKVYIDTPEDEIEFTRAYEEQFERARIRFSDKYISIQLDLSGMEAPQVKERLGKIGSLMLASGFSATDTLPPDEPDPEPEPEPEPQPQQPQRSGFFQRQTTRQTQQQGQTQMQTQMQTQRPGQPQMQRQGQPQMQRPGQPQTQRQPPLQHMQQRPQRPGTQQPVYEEPKVPFEEYKVLEKLVQIFINGVNKTSRNMFTTLFHGYNLAGKMLHPMKDDVQIVFYGQLMNNVTDQFRELAMEMNQKYGKVPMRMIGGSCEIILYLEGKDPALAKEMLGCVSGFMMKNNIAAINLPNTIGAPLATYTAETFQPTKPSGPRSLGGVAPTQGGMPAQPGRTYPSAPQGAPQQGGDGGNSFAKNFLRNNKK